jgi:predicted Zn-dependent protease
MWFLIAGYGGEEMNTRIEKLEDFLKDNPENALLQYSLGVEYLKIGQPERAIASLRVAIAAKTDYSAAYRELGKAMGQAGLTAEAAAIYRQGIQTAQTNGDLQTAREMRVFLKRLTGEVLTAEEECCE